MSQIVSADQIRLVRLRAQCLLQDGSSQPHTPVGVLQTVPGVQAQELPAALLSMRARSAGLTASSIEQARQQERSIAWTSALRGTLHLLAAEDVRWLIPLLGPMLIAADRRRMEQLGWDETSAARGLALIRDELGNKGPLSRLEITHLLEKHGLPCSGQAPVHLLFRAALEGILCYGPDRGKEHTYALFEDWLGAVQSLPRKEALAKLALRYLAAYGPAAPEDLAYWAGLKQEDAKLAWHGLPSDQFVELTVAGEPRPLWMLNNQIAWLETPAPAKPVVRLLPRFDTLWMGYVYRSLLIEPEYARRINSGGGMIRAFVLVDGKILGTWTTWQKLNRLEVILEPFEQFSASAIGVIEAEVHDMGRFLMKPMILQTR